MTILQIYWGWDHVAKALYRHRSPDHVHHYINTLYSRELRFARYRS